MKLARTALLSGVGVAAAAVCANLAFTSSNTVAASQVGSASAAITAAALQKAVCAATPTTTVSGAANPLNGTAAADLILGTRNNTQTLNGGGKDCIVAGSLPNGKTITMSPSTGSVCVKGPGPGSYAYGAGCAVKA